MGKNSIFRKLFVLFLWILLPVNVLLVLYAAIILNNAESKMLQDKSTVLETYMSQLDSNLDQMRAALNHEYMTGKFLLLQQSNAENAENEFEWYAAQTRVLLDFEEWLTYYPALQGVYAYFTYTDAEPVFMSTIEIQNDFKSRLRTIISELSEQPKRVVAEWKIEIYDGTSYLYMVQKKNNMYFGCWLSINNLLSAWNLNGQEGQVYCFKDNEDTVVASSRTDMVGLGAEETEALIGKKSRSVTIGLQNKSLFLEMYLYRFWIVRSLPGFIFPLLLLAVAAFAMFPFLYYLIRKYIQKPVNEMLTGIEKISEGNVDYRIPCSASEGEFAVLKDGFNHMVDEVLDTRIKANEKEIERQRIQMRYLTQQIQPHFILNALNILYSYEPEEFNLAQKMILCLSKYFRYVVRVQSEFVELFQELDHIRNYLEIQEARFENNFQYSVTVPESLRDIIVPPLLVQNFVENSIKYAMSMTRRITIRVYVEEYGESQIRICVEDTGKGLSEEVLKAICIFKETHVYQDDLGIGIQNAIERVDVIYKGDSSIEFGNLSTGGARIDIVLPKWTRKTVGVEKNENSTDRG